MKVLSYLQVQTSPKGLIELIPKWLVDKWEDIDFLCNFYSQPFKPEIITELFDGWKEDEDMNWLNKNNYKLIQISDGYDYIQYHILKEDYSMCFYIPRTLDEFILDCQRAGIILEWRVK